MPWKNLIASAGTLGLRTNSDYVGWSFGHPPKPGTDAEFEACALPMTFEVDPLESLPERVRGLEKYHYWRSGPELGTISYERTFTPGNPIRLEVSGIDTGRPHMVANRNFVRWIRFRFNNLHSPGYHLTDLASAMLLQQGLSPLHCSAFRVGESTVVVVAPPDTGKTLTTMQAVEAGADFLAEDLAITDGTTLFSCPWTSTFRYYEDLSKGWRSRYRMKLVRVFPPAELLPAPSDSRTVDAYIAPHRIIDRAPITHVAVLSRRDGTSRELDPDEATRALLNLNRYEFPYLKNPMLLAYSYFHPDFDLRALVQREESVLEGMAKSARTMQVLASDAREFTPQILEWVERTSP
jgi:hypothetical protein